ncbi:MAG: peptidylprolyl isomerase [Clostridia bacterium]|nr:peptidylprolyl isomerase [Clostridia bacterium]
MRFWLNLCVFLFVVLLLFGCSLAGAEDPVVVRVGDVRFTKSQVHPLLQTDIQLVQVIDGVYLTEEERKTQKEATIERIIGVGLIEAKLEDAGQNDFTEEEEAILKENARNYYEQLWQGIWQKVEESGENFTEDQLSEFLEDSGYTVKAIYEEMKASERRFRAVGLFCPGLVITEDMIQEYYREQFLNPDRERYENNLDLYEEEILAQRNESFYTPEGYRGIKQILLSYPGEVERALRNERARVNLDVRQLSSAVQALVAAATTAETWEDMKDARASYDAADEEMNAALKDYTEKRKKRTEPLIQPTAEAIRNEMEKSADFDSLIRKYSTDTSETNLGLTGYPFHPESKNWSKEFAEAARALEKPGDISRPVYSDLGVHILYYAAQIPGGEHVLTQEEEEMLRSSAMDYYQGLELDKLIEEWKKDYEIEVHPEYLED